MPGLLIYLCHITAYVRGMSGCEYNKSKKYNIPNIDNTEATQSGPGQTFKRAHFALKRKNSFDLHISSQIDKIIKKLQWISNTILSTSVLGIFYEIIILDDVKTDLSTHGSRNI